MRPIVATAAALLLVAAAACGGGSSPTSPSSTSSSSSSTSTSTGTSSGSGTASSSATITIGSNGAVSPQSVTIAAGGRVTFVNNDTRSHDMSSDPHPEHTDCPAINQVGFLSAGQSRSSGNFTATRTCGFHDHDQPTNRSLQGTIVVQ